MKALCSAFKKILKFIYIESNSHFYIKVCTSSHFQEWIHIAVVSNPNFVNQENGISKKPLIILQLCAIIAKEKQLID